MSYERASDYQHTPYHIISERFIIQYHIHSIAVPQKHTMRGTRGTVVQVKWMRSICACENLIIRYCSLYHTYKC